MLTDANPLLALAFVLVAGVMSGQLATRIGLPSVTGQILAGIVLGPSVLRVFTESSIHGLEPITRFALSLIAVTVGSHLHLKKLRNATRRLSWQVALESTLTPGLVLIGVLAFGGTHWALAGMLAAAAISTAPATIVALVKEAHAKGVFVKTLVATVALNNIACVALFELAHTAAQVAFDPSRSHSFWDLTLAPFRALLSAGALGGAVGVALVMATRHVVRSDRLAAASIIGILATAGLADLIDTSSLLACMFLGVALANLTPEKDELGHGVFENFEAAIFAVFFTLAGAELDFGYVVPGGLLALLVVTLRMAGKLSASRIAMHLAGATENVRRYLGMALIPQAGVAVALLLLVKTDPHMAPVADLFLAVGLTVVTLNEIIGPILTRVALNRSGDAGKDRARLIDFIHEENITTELRAETKKEAIRQLVELMIASHHLNVDREAFLKTVLAREEEISTCIGEGLAVPHGTIDQGSAILGVMGISAEGLHIDTPDGVPVHCMVLLATPRSQRDRHLEVLAALARAFGSDRNIQSQLFGAHSPAHAYEILHAEESEDFNYFLDDESVL